MVLVTNRDLLRQGKRKVIIGGGKSSGFMKTFKKWIPKLKAIAPIALPIVGSLVASKFFSNNPARAEKVQSVLNTGSQLINDPTRVLQERGNQFIDRYAPSIMPESSRQALRDQLDETAVSVGNNEMVKNIQKKAKKAVKIAEPALKQMVKKQVQETVEDVVEDVIEEQTGNGLSRKNKNKMKRLILGSGLMKY